MQRKEIEQIYIKKIEELKRYDKAYFQNDRSLVSDKEYDDIKKLVLDLEKKYNFSPNCFSFGVPCFFKKFTKWGGNF